MDGVVYRSDNRDIEVLHQEQTVGKALVIMDDVELESGLKGTYPVVGTYTEGQHLRECPQAHHQELVETKGITHTGKVLPEGVRRLVEIQALQLMQCDTVHYFRVGWPGYDMHLVTKVTELPREIVDVYALPTAIRVAPVGQ